MSTAVLPVIAVPARSTAVVQGRRHSWPAYASCGAVLLLAVLLFPGWRGHFNFDDAFMYSRYALNLRHGDGMAWNPGGPHTFGITSLPWFFVILAGSFVCSNPALLLPAASCLTGLVALASLTRLINGVARSRGMQRFSMVFPLVALPLLLNWRFVYNWGNGMETMLAILSVTLFLQAHQGFRFRPGTRHAVTLAFAGLLCVLVRPELLLLVLSFPVISILSSRNGGTHRVAAARTWRPFLQYAAVLLVLVATVLFLNRLYFGTPVPLAFYLKSMHGYDGYRLFINPVSATGTFLGIATVPLLAIAATAQRRHIPFLLTYLLPVALGIVYLATVTQIMGDEARYYLPLLPLLIVPAALLLDEKLSAGTDLRLTPARLLALFCACLVTKDCTSQLTVKFGSLVAHQRTYFQAPVFHTAPAPALPSVDVWAHAMDFARALPAGSTMTATEVGRLGAMAPQIRIIDAAGLNDAYMARHPNTVDYLFAQHAEFLWLPHPDYTALYGAVASDPRLLQQYDVYAGALNFGFAIRKDVARQPAVMARIRQAWQAVYPGYPMENYRVQSITWDQHARLHGSAPYTVD